MANPRPPVQQAEAQRPPAVSREPLFSTRNVVAITVGTALYAGLALLFDFLNIGIGLVTLKPAVAVPVVFGFVFGPAAGFLSGFLGSFVSDPFYSGNFLWSWELGNGLIGLLPAVGYYAIKRSSWTRPIGLAASSALAIVASRFGTGIASLLDYSFKTGLAAYSVMAEFVPTATTDVVNAAILAPIMLYFYAISTPRLESKTAALP